MHLLTGNELSQRISPLSPDYNETGAVHGVPMNFIGRQRHLCPVLGHAGLRGLS